MYIQTWPLSSGDYSREVVDGCTPELSPWDEVRTQVGRMEGTQVHGIGHMCMGWDTCRWMRLRCMDVT